MPTLSTLCIMEKTRRGGLDLSDLSVENHAGIWSHFSDSMLRGHSEEQYSVNRISRCELFTSQELVSDR